jgi:hypothetical protein
LARGFDGLGLDTIFCGCGKKAYPRAEGLGELEARAAIRQMLVLPDGPTARGAAIPWRFFFFFFFSFFAS